MKATTSQMVRGVAGAAFVMALAGRGSLHGQGGGACGMQLNNASVAFCETFDHPSTVTNRSGRINGHVHASVPLPFPAAPAFFAITDAWRSVALPVSQSDLVPGTQSIVLSGDQGMVVANVNIVLAGAGGLPGGAPAAPTNLRIVGP
jgi:hypothetical protein